MRKEYTGILETIDNVCVKGDYFYSDYLAVQLKKKYTLKFINEIINKSKKTTSEAIIILLAAIRYLQKDIYALTKIEKTDSFEFFINEHYEQIMEISIKKKVQGNIPERGLPISEILSKKLTGASIGLIELGASYGMIGSYLINPKPILENKDKYFHSTQQMPKNPKNIDYYLGIDIDPPEKEWLIACFSNPEDAKNVEQYIRNIQLGNNFKLMKASALGFSAIKEVKDIAMKDYTIVLLTSFMLYQLNEEQQKQLKDEIIEFTHNFNGHWINQDVELSNSISGPEYFIEWNGERILKLQDDRCCDWNWLN